MVIEIGKIVYFYLYGPQKVIVKNILDNGAILGLYGNLVVTLVHDRVSQTELECYQKQAVYLDILSKSIAVQQKEIAEFIKNLS